MQLSSPESSEAHTRLSFGRWRPCRLWTGPAAKCLGDANVRQICGYADSLYTNALDRLKGAHATVRPLIKEGTDVCRHHCCIRRARPGPARLGATMAETRPAGCRYGGAHTTAVVVAPIPGRYQDRSGCWSPWRPRGFLAWGSSNLRCNRLFHCRGDHTPASPRLQGSRRAGHTTNPWHHRARTENPVELTSSNGGQIDPLIAPRRFVSGALHR